MKMLLMGDYAEIMKEAGNLSPYYVERNAGHFDMNKTGRLDDNGKDIYQDIAYPVAR